MLRERTDDECGGDDGKGHLKRHEYTLGNRSAETVHSNTIEESLAETPNPLLHGPPILERKTVSIKGPQYRHHRRNGEALHQDREHVLAAYHACVEK